MEQIQRSGPGKKRGLMNEAPLACLDICCVFYACCSINCMFCVCCFINHSNEAIAEYTDNDKQWKGNYYQDCM